MLSKRLTTTFSNKLDQCTIIELLAYLLLHSDTIMEHSMRYLNTSMTVQDSIRSRYASQKNKQFKVYKLLLEFSMPYF